MCFNFTSHIVIIAIHDLIMSSEFQTALFGNKLITKTGEQDSVTALKGKKIVGVYFSAHWCDIF